MRYCSICRQVLVQIRDNIPLDPHVFHVKGHARSGDRIKTRGMIHKIGGKRCARDILLLEVAGKLVQNGRDDLQMRELFGTYLTSVIVYDIIGVTTYKRRITYGNHQRVQRYY